MTAKIRWVELDLNAPTQSRFSERREDEMAPPLNWVPANGWLVPRESWLPNGITSLPSPLTSRGMHLGWRQAGAVSEIQVVHYDGTNYDFWAKELSTANEGSPEVTGAWTSRDANVLVSSVYRDVPVNFTVGKSGAGGGTGDLLYYGNPGFDSGGPNVARGRYQDTTAAAFEIGTDFTAGYTSAFHLNRFWIGGCPDIPGYLKFSEIGDVTSWNTSENFIPIGSDDVPIWDLLVWDRGLVIGKGDGLFWLGGSTLDSFQVIKISDIGCAPGRSMVVTPHGVYYIGSDTNLYLWDGGEVRKVNTKTQLATRTITVSLGGVIPIAFWTLAWCVDRLYISRTGTASNANFIDVYVPDRDLWYAEQTGGSVAGWEVQAFNQGWLVGMPKVSETAYTPATFRHVDADPFTDGDHLMLPDDGVTYAFNASWGYQQPNALKGKTTLRELVIRYRQYWDPSTGVSVTVTADEAVADSKTIGPKATEGVYTDHLQFGVTGERVSVALQHMAADASGLYEIQRIVLGYLVDEDRR